MTAVAHILGIKDTEYKSVMKHFGSAKQWAEKLRYLDIEKLSEINFEKLDAFLKEYSIEAIKSKC